MEKERVWLNVIFINEKNNTFGFYVIDASFGKLRGNQTAYVEGGYSEYKEYEIEGLKEWGDINRRLKCKLYKCKKTGRPIIFNGNTKWYLKNIEDDEKIFKNEHDLKDKLQLR